MSRMYTNRPAALDNLRMTIKTQCLDSDLLIQVIWYLRKEGHCIQGFIIHRLTNIRTEQTIKLLELFRYSLFREQLKSRALCSADATVERRRSYLSERSGTTCKKFSKSPEKTSVKQMKYLSTFVLRFCNESKRQSSQARTVAVRGISTLRIHQHQEIKRRVCRYACQRTTGCIRTVKPTISAISPKWLPEYKVAISVSIPVSPDGLGLTHVHV